MRGREVEEVEEEAKEEAEAVDPGMNSRPVLEEDGAEEGSDPLQVVLQRETQ